ncbi:MAG: YfiR family protein [Sphaerotilus sulfidivorans]|uniref:YfiR family protein n=1 Tax=Sphaerotilus sulfidivorans TaxID=639200 RepID=UPI003F2DBC99
MRAALFPLVTALAVAVLAPLRSAQAGSDEAMVQAAFVANFARFTQWPAAVLPQRQGVMQLCQYGQREDLEQALRALQGRPLQGASVQWRQIQRAEEARGCHLLFVTEPGLALVALTGQPVLTVSDQPGFVQRGGMIGLLRHGGRLRFEIHLGAASQAGLKLSSDLLSLAVGVIEAPLRREGAP